MEISNLSDTKLKTLVIRMFKELSEDFNSIKTIWSEMKNTPIEIKNNLQGNNSTLDEAQWCGSLPVVSVCCGRNGQIHKAYQDLWSKRDSMAALSRGELLRVPWPLSLEESTWSLPWQAFIAFLGTLHWGWSSFTMYRFALGGYLLQKTKERVLLITSKRKDICKCKGKSG